MVALSPDGLFIRTRVTTDELVGREWKKLNVQDNGKKVEFMYFIKYSGVSIIRTRTGKSKFVQVMESCYFSSKKAFEI